MAVSVAITVMLCVKRRSPLSSDDDYLKKDSNKTGQLTINTKSSALASTGHHHHHHHHHNHNHSGMSGQSVIDTGSSGADSDMKMEIRTASSLSEHVHWDDLSEPPPPSTDPSLANNQIQQVVDSIYNYTNQPICSPSKVRNSLNSSAITSFERSRPELLSLTACRSYKHL